ncbi:unnamed protein product, partial [Musa acuminata var. zebrina]
IITTCSLNIDTVSVSTYNMAIVDEYKLNFSQSYHLYQWSSLTTRIPSMPNPSASSTSPIASPAPSTVFGNFTTIFCLIFILPHLLNPKYDESKTITVHSCTNPHLIHHLHVRPLHHQREQRVPRALPLEACGASHIPQEAMEGVLKDSVHRL